MKSGLLICIGTEFDIEIDCRFSRYCISLNMRIALHKLAINKYQFNKSYPMFSTPGPRSVFIPC